MSLALVAILIALAALCAIAFGPSAVAAVRARTRRRPATRTRDHDPGRERRAERRAQELLRSVVGEEEFSLYRELGFLRAPGHGEGYAYLIYPHRPIVAYDTDSGELLNEYCVAFPDDSDPGLGERLPDSDDVLAKWMALRGGERELIADSNMHMPGRQIDPGQVQRDLRRLREWEGRRGAGSAEPRTRKLMSGRSASHL
jgi:hypothetical protein